MRRSFGDSMTDPSEKAQKVLLVEPDGAALERLVEALARHLNPHITCVSDASACVDVEMRDPHDLVIAEFDLGGVSGLDMAERLGALGNRPIILLADDATRDEVAQAMRLGVRDLFFKPFPMERLIDAADRLMRERAMLRRRAAKYGRMRRLVRRVVTERRDLNRRIDLVCRDLVEAQRKLVHRVLAIEQRRTPQSN
jgi:DNA-binding NtrC family response regulator